MIHITRDDYISLRTRSVTLEKGRWGYSKYLPYVITEQDVVMLSSVFSRLKATQINIQVKKQYSLSHQDLIEKMHELENKYKRLFQEAFDAINFLLQKEIKDSEQKQRIRIGFNPGDN